MIREKICHLINSNEKVKKGKEIAENFILFFYFNYKEKQGQKCLCS